MKKSFVCIVSLFMLVLFVSGCNADKNVEKELNNIMETITESESNQYYYHLVESLLANEQDEELINLTLIELENGEKKLKVLKVKTKKAKKVIDYYIEAFNYRETVVSILKKKQTTEEDKARLQKAILLAEENEYLASEIIVKELNLKDIEN